MIALTTPYLWYTTRATGIVALLLLTVVVTLGTLVANRVGGAFIGRFEVNEIHRSLSMVAVVFLVIHIVTTVLDSFVSTGLASALIPMTSSYKRVPVTLGTISFDLIMAVWVSSLLKLRIKNQTWRFIHWFSWLSYAIALVHVYLTGTDTHKGVGVVLVLGCAGVVALAGTWRFLRRPTRAAGRTALSPLASAPVPPRPRLPDSVPRDLPRPRVPQEFPKSPPRAPGSRGRR
ncbi:MAG: ferric reductase-like transmembrane domain-containing protein [Acidobacteria bacterium]|nr:ferric reductase-like transmembrane domain-containing protein [Acidobacteriota bacterium]